jgi:hypothetical protein
VKIVFVTYARIFRLVTTISENHFRNLRKDFPPPIRVRFYLLVVLFGWGEGVYRWKCFRLSLPTETTKSNAINLYVCSQSVGINFMTWSRSELKRGYQTYLAIIKGMAGKSDTKKWAGKNRSGKIMPCFPKILTPGCGRRGQDVERFQGGEDGRKRVRARVSRKGAKLPD